MSNQQCSLTIIKASQNIHNFMKVSSRNIYFGTEFKKSQKFLPQKFEAIRYTVETRTQ